ncbi:hypothetical protein A8F94_10280 [Bacillus sp. FJAT-27225]|uniref:cell wall-binding repeat-containing protein n=1 Tax=Bacillus sp. FJAT-27225 TaxID=1743144 RepID=UPI00080C2826|nr:cell wall-binding repeat-containing protein [Bacillus sp. FJAT-27225]OCA88187.1 hypothetical protein A8F94_10280 [Bacillus sp. FJAT-27225]
MKLVSKLSLSLATVFLVASCVMTNLPARANSGPAVSEGNEKLKAEQYLSMAADRVEPAPVQLTAASTETNATSVTLANKIDMYQFHEYWFVTFGGTLTVENQGSSEDVEYLIYEVGTEELIEETAPGKYILEEGTGYYFVTMGLSDTPVGYNYVLRGDFNIAPDPILPKLEITNWPGNEIRLSKGTFASYPAEGIFDGYYLEVDINNGNETYPVYNIENDGTFKFENIHLAAGQSEIIFTGRGTNQNIVTEMFTILLPGTMRIPGKDRYEVSSNVYSVLEYRGFGSDTIILARGDLYPDALSGGPLAYMENAPVLLTRTNKLEDRIKARIADYQPERVIILGGEGSVSPAVVEQLKNLGVTDIQRIGGSDRYAVSASLAERVSSGMDSDMAIIASGEVFPDALSASSIAGPAGMPILLVRSGTIPASIETFIKNHPEISNYIIVGGPGTVKDTVISKVKQLRPGAVVERISGKDRYEVSINVAKYSMANYRMDLSTIAFVRGDLFPDALSGAPLANYHFAPILLTTSAKLEGKVANFLEANRGKTDLMFLVGGEGSITPQTESQLKGYIK